MSSRPTGDVTRRGRGSRSAAAWIPALALLTAAPVAPAQPNPYNTVGLQWTASGDDGSVGRASQYDLRYSTAAIAGTDTVTWWNGATRASGLPTPSPAGTVDSTRITGLTPGTRYFFVLRVADEVPNWSRFSNVAEATTDSCDAPTTAPGQFQAAEDAGDALLTWSAVSDPKAVEIHIYRGTGSGGALSQIASLSPTATSYRDTSVSAGTTYRYRAALAAACAEGPSTSTLSITLSGPPPPPPPATPEASRVHAYPNPSSGPVTIVVIVNESTPQAVRLRLFDLTGHLLADLADGIFPPGASQMIWNRTTRTGNAVTPGYYELHGNIGSREVRERLVLLP